LIRPTGDPRHEGDNRKSTERRTLLRSTAQQKEHCHDDTT
jgi:hypothetical protein